MKVITKKWNNIGCFIVLLVLFYGHGEGQTLPMIPFESDDNTTSTYDELIEFYTQVANDWPQASLQISGKTDIGKPLHTFILAGNDDFTPEKSKAAKKTVIFINNGIHPGEPDGIDACQLLVKTLLSQKNINEILDKITIVIIPVYNVGGMLNRRAHTRANQNGPAECGFRGNAKNLDLNRDFMKCDSKNAIAFNTVFSAWDPDVFLDTHTSDGADYAYTMTLIATHPQKLEQPMSDFLNEKFLPYLYDTMAKSKWPMIPYVNSEHGLSKGIEGFIDLPRYSTGYAALHHTYGFMTETHMLKPYKNRVQSTLDFIQHLINFTYSFHQQIKESRVKDKAISETSKTLPISFQLDQSVADSLYFLGYKEFMDTSFVTGLPIRKYDTKAPYNRNIPYFNRFKPIAFTTLPQYYIVPSAYEKVIELLKINGAPISLLDKDTTLTTTMYRIKDIQTSSYPYESHYVHTQVVCDTLTMTKKWYAGDALVSTSNAAVHYIIQALEPTASDSWFCWNFFDGILNQKEYFSEYVFDAYATQYLTHHPELKQQIEDKKKENPDINNYELLSIVYKNSPYFEPTFRLYPIGRIEYP